MKKTRVGKPRKLTLKVDTVKTLNAAALTQVMGGATAVGCQHPTTTVLPTGRC